MSKVLFDNGELKIVESMNNYFVKADNFRVVYDSECQIERVCIKKGGLNG